ncbi:NUDIX domain-containing protein [Candidatus Shapirobacteria bacterium]|nr:NUDIX domain-containing protein [Candidatus Shapirobacteria bacterium]
MSNEIIFENVLREFSERLPRFSDGRIDYSDSNKAPVLTCFVRFNNKILLLKRSDKVRVYQGLWNSVAGYLDEFRPLEEKALEELREELGITADIIKQTKLGQPYELTDNKANRTWVIFPVLVELNREPVIKLDWEHTDYKWIDPDDLKSFDIVPDLDKTLAQVL